MALRHYIVALVLCGLSVAALGMAQRSMGINRDEAVYFDAAVSYKQWFGELASNIKRGELSKSFSRAEIDRRWGANHEHPVLMKTAFAVSEAAFHRPLKIFGWGMNRPALSQASAFRLPSWLITGFAVALLYLFGVHIAGPVAGATAALSYITIPHIFFHGQIACFDSAVATMWLLVVYCYFRSLSSAWWGWLTGIAFGLALATKHNAWFLPAVLFVHYAIVVRPDYRLLPPLRVPFWAVSLIVIGVPLFVAHWPWLWWDTIPRFGRYFGFHLHHVHYNIEYLGLNWNDPPHPMSYPFGMTLFTLPTAVLILSITGIFIFALPYLRVAWAKAWRQRLPPLDDPWRFAARRTWLRPGLGLNPRIGTLLCLNAFFPLLLFAWPSTPIFGGTKHFLSAFAFLSLLAGVAAEQFVRSLKGTNFLAHVARWGLPVCLAFPGALGIFFSHPFELSNYNALAGGPAGGANLGLNRQFWGHSTRVLLPWINSSLPRGTNIYWHDTAHSAYRWYQEEGLLRGDIRYSGTDRHGIAKSDVAFVIHELHFNKYDYWIWADYGVINPSKVITLDGVPLVSVYTRPAAKNLATLNPAKMAEFGHANGAKMAK